MDKHEAIEWNGERWYFWSDYYKNRKGVLLHRAKYKEHFGPIPEGLDVHHVDGNKVNNDLDNLVAVSRSEHVRRHEPRGFIAWSSGQRSDSAKEQWRKREPRTLECAWCGKEFESTGARAKFCHPNCKQADLRQRRRESGVGKKDAEPLPGL